MRRLALASLTFDRAKLGASLAGVSFAALLVWAQIGLYFGFLAAASGLIRHVGGDLWVMARGVETLENNETVSSGTRALVAAAPCVAGVRAVAANAVPVRKPSGAIEWAFVIGADSTRSLLPWQTRAGLPADLHGPRRVSVDDGDLRKLQLPDDPIGRRILINGLEGEIAVLTTGIRSFTMTPYVFTTLENARRFLQIGDGEVSFWVVDLSSPGCAEAAVEHIGRHPELQALRTQKFAEMTEDFWIGGSGAGLVLTFSAILGLGVGVMVVGQTLYSITRAHLKELSHLRAVGATRAQLVSFVGWQVALLISGGSAIGILLTLGVRSLAAEAGLNIVLSAGTVAAGGGIVLLMCLAAATASVRTVLALEGTEVFS
jgi:putative ABC transport system permease protein